MAARPLVVRCVFGLGFTIVFASLGVGRAQITAVIDSKAQAFFCSRTDPTGPPFFPPTGGPSAGVYTATHPPGAGAAIGWTPGMDAPVHTTTTLLLPVAPSSASLPGTAGVDFLPFVGSPFIFSATDTGVAGTSQTTALVSLTGSIVAGSEGVVTAADIDVPVMPLLHQDPLSPGGAWILLNFSADYSIGAAGVSPGGVLATARTTGTLWSQLTVAKVQARLRFWNATPPVPVSLGGIDMESTQTAPPMLPFPFTCGCADSCGGMPVCDSGPPIVGMAGPGTLRITGFILLQAMRSEIYYTALDSAGPPGNSYCFGDGTLPTPCPCVPPNTVPSPSGAPGHGCANSLNLDGAWLTATGTTSPDTVVFKAYISPIYVGFGLMVKGNGSASNGIAAADGIRCADGALIRFGAHSAGMFGAPSGTWTYPNSNQTNPVSVQTAQLPGQSAFYQLFYRNGDVTFCNAATTNWSNGYEINW